MPEVSRFFGTIIHMYFDEQAPPHFPATYGEYEAQVGIDPIEVLGRQTAASRYPEPPE